MPRFNVQHPVTKEWRCFSTIVDDYVTDWMDEKRYQRWRIEQYGKQAGEIRDANLMDYGEAEQIIADRERWEEEGERGMNTAIDKSIYGQIKTKGEQLAELAKMAEDIQNNNDKNAAEAYQRGLDDAWECAKKLFSTMSDTEIEKVFPVEWKSGFSGLMQMKPQYAMAKIKAYEEKQNDKIEVGDEVEPFYTDITGVVTLIDGDTIYILWRDGSSTSAMKLKEVTKTGRHFDIASILEAMKHD